MLGGILGLLQQEPQYYFQDNTFIVDTAYTSEQIDKLIQDRIAARKKGDYTKADHIRKELLDVGIVLEDNLQGTTWRRG
jgi:cysteinyl-tRNA synthetase